MFEHYTAMIIHRRFEDGADHLGILVNDGREGNDVNHSLHLVLLRMMQGKPQTGQCLAAAGGHAQRINAFVTHGTVTAMIGNIPSDLINRILDGESLQVLLKAFNQQSPFDVLPIKALFRSSWLLEISGINTVCVDQTTEQKTHEQPNLE